MIEVKILKKAKSGSTTTGVTTVSYGGAGTVTYAARAGRAEHAEEAELAEEASHAAEADHATAADEAAKATEADHAAEAGHATTADKAATTGLAEDADKWDGAHRDEYLDQPVRTTDEVRHAGVVTDELRSAGTFVDGLLGSGARLWKDEEGVTRLTLDRLTVRQTMNVMELLIEKIRSVGGQLVASAANGKVKSVEETEDAYRMTFEEAGCWAAHDLMRCQTWTGSEMRGYWVEIASTDGETVTVKKSEFAESGTVPQEGDECVLMGNTTDGKRQNLVLMSATEDGQPRVDVMSGVSGKTLEGALRARLGNLDGIRSDELPSDRQPQGDGLYADNAYLKGTFVLQTGEDVKTRLEATEGLVRSSVESVRDDYLSERGCLNNPAFAQGLEKWNAENGTMFLQLGSKWIVANGNVLTRRGEGVSLTTDEGRTVARIVNGEIRQRNSDLLTVPEMPVKSDGVKEALPVYLTFSYRCVKAGTLTIGFDGVDTTGFAAFTPMAVTEAVTETDGYQQYTCSGRWNGTGDFRLRFTGEMTVSGLSLSTDRADALAYKYQTLFEQSAKVVRIAALNFDEKGQVLEGSEIVTTSKWNTLTSERFNEDGSLKNQAGLVTTTDFDAWRNGTYSTDLSGIRSTFDDYVKTEAFAGLFATAVDDATDIVKQAQIAAFVSKTADGYLESGVKVKADNITLEGSEIVTISKWNALVSERFNEDGSLKNQAGLMTAADFETWKSGTYSTDLSGIRSTFDDYVKTEAFAGLFATAVDDATDIVKQAQIAAFVSKTADGYLESGVKVKADNITLEGLVTANDYFKVLTDGSIEAKNAKIYGSLRVPFEPAPTSTTIDYADNVAMISVNGKWETEYSLPWDTAQSGRRITVVNYMWKYLTSSGYASLTAPTGQYFYEDGVKKSELRLSQQAVVLLGYGTESTFYGWIVLRRTMVGGSYSCGSELGVLAYGNVSCSASGIASKTVKTFDTYDGSNVMVTRNPAGSDSLSGATSATGVAYLWLPKAWFSAASHIHCMVCGYGPEYGRTEPVYANVYAITSASYKSTTTLNGTTATKSTAMWRVEIHTADDPSENDGGFCFEIKNYNTW